MTSLTPLCTSRTRARELERYSTSTADRTLVAGSCVCAGRGRDDGRARLRVRLLEILREREVLRLLWHMTVEALFHRVCGDWLGGIAAGPRLEPPAACRPVLLRVLDHEGNGLAGGAFQVATVIHRREVADIVSEHGAVRVRGRAAALQTVQPGCIH